MMVLRPLVRQPITKALWNDRCRSTFFVRNTCTINEVHTDVSTSFLNISIGEICFKIQKVYFFFENFRRNGDPGFEAILVV